MARLGAADLSAGVETALYAPATDIETTVKVIFANRTPAIVLVRVIRRVGAGPTAAADYLAFDEPIGPNQSRHSEYFDMVDGEELLVRANVSGMSVQADGIEEDVS